MGQPYEFQVLRAPAAGSQRATARGAGAEAASEWTKQPPTHSIVPGGRPEPFALRPTAGLRLGVQPPQRREDVRHPVLQPLQPRARQDRHDRVPSRVDLRRDG
jgi:hypothetical protein